MSRLFITLLTFILCLSLESKEKETFNTVDFQSLPALTTPCGEGLSGHFAGHFSHQLIVAGGSNFTSPLVDGGKKQFYDDIRILSLKDTLKGWQTIGHLKHSVAYGASVTLPEGLLCFGGSDGTSPTNRVFLLHYDGVKVDIKLLTPLPLPLEQMAVAFDESNIYIVGGKSEEGASRRVFMSNKEQLLKCHSKAWKELPSIPGVGRIQPSAAVQQSNVGNGLYIFGGFNSSLGSTLSNGYYYSFQTHQWSQPFSLPSDNKALVGTTALPGGSQFIYCFGGVNAKHFDKALQRESLIKKSSLANIDSLQQASIEYLSHPSDWYEFQNELYIFNTITQTWTKKFPSKRLARAGASIVDMGSNTYIIIGGELKPGVRSTDVTQMHISYNAHFGWLNWIVLSLYLLAMIGIGIYFMRRQKGGEDFFKGGGRIPWWAAGISIFATMLSAITYMSIPAKAYATDWSYYPMQICILIVSFPVIRYYLPFFRKLNVTSAYEYLELRFNYGARLLSSILFMIFMVARMALVLFLPSLAMTAVTGIDIYLCIVLMAIITIIYCTMGGMEAVVWGDVIQGIILVGGAILAAVYLIGHTGGGAEGFLNIATENNKFKLFDWSLDYRSATFWVVILGGLSNNLISYTSDQTVIQRYLTTKDEKSAGQSILTNGLMSVFVTIAFFTIGTGLYTFFHTHPDSIDITMNNTDTVFPFFMMSQLPSGIAGLLIAAIFAATMSTIGSNINSVSTAFTIDIWKRLHPNLNAKATVHSARVSGVVSGILGMLIALLMATLSIQSLLDYFNTILGLLSGGIGALFMMGIFFPRIGTKAALSGFGVGTAVVFYLNFYTPLNFLLFGFISIAVSVSVAFLLSFIWKSSKDSNGLTI